MTAAELQWRDGCVPVSTRFDDPFFSLAGGLAETRHVFLAGNDLPARFRDGFHIAELGFGTGLNFLATLRAWEDSGRRGRFRFTSFEAWPMARDDMARALGAFPCLAPQAEALLARWNGAGGRLDIGPAVLTVIRGDARQTLPEWRCRADAWYLDGFAPARNPELWQPGLMREVARHTAPGGTAATYTAAGFVRRGLESAGFRVSREKGHGGKRHMTRAVLP
ncbi:tRNA (5-methylaminomethyl-2-thiouridine)(34)-methyltransferase MnmD [Pontibaca methylaminivorans]|uniref:tRNA U34 5-methylaminomethyl-2-thiouridine-forming methyltransferase MnmC n=2 Tax=Pontibaca methylaminivorans TaxID=515897 RepID=A0A1R3WRF7_9RHOB|nr:tRNA (5-methylaminomethyl-2-thiouridine)(34)-methyltransferase MnmD [Pontibaca methylaminivorans]SIT79845.1 tRNA U34 5-methylaminomethyl-2-thiouridine-forming methyltransferase MnmC [Pontibaca methylaminivorans]